MLCPSIAHGELSDVMMNLPLISVVMPVWNGERYLQKAISSILNQTFTDFEFLIIDDGSTDSTPLMLAEYAAIDHRIRIITLNHAGIVAALNRGVDESCAEWIARMDCDDEAHPDRLRRQWDAIKETREAVLCHSNVMVVNNSQPAHPNARFIRSSALLELRLCYRCAIVHPTVLFHKNTFIACGKYKEEERHAEDFGLWGRMLSQGGIVGIPDALLDFRVHDQSISKLKSLEQQKISREIAIRNCMQFMRMNKEDATLAHEALHEDPVECSFSRWIWFLTHGLPRLRHKSLELWAWILIRSVRVSASSILKSFGPG